MDKCEWCQAQLTGHEQHGKVESVEVAPGVCVALCAECCKEAQQIEENFSQENLGETLHIYIPELPGVPAFVWESGR